SRASSSASGRTHQKNPVGSACIRRRHPSWASATGMGTAPNDPWLRCATVGSSGHSARTSGQSGPHSGFSVTPRTLTGGSVVVDGCAEDEAGPAHGRRDSRMARQRRGRVTTRAETGVTEDAFLLQQRDAAFVDTDPWRASRIIAEVVEGFDALARIPPAVSLFGSARITEADPFYDAARKVGSE